jgi:hypothetical protein
MRPNLTEVAGAARLAFPPDAPRALPFPFAVEVEALRWYGRHGQYGG